MTIPTEISRYNPRVIEAKWQDIWQEQQTFVVTENSTKPKYYVLVMFPYPSGHLHMGHMRVYSLGDVFARFKRAQGYNVLHPMGWDAFGLPAENAAIQNGAHPADWTLANIATMREQLKLIGLSYDWSRELATCLPEYYQHEQRFFLAFLKAGLAYRKESQVNWDPVDNTVLANEQVVEGRGWRSGALVERRTLSQWFLRISAFADDLLTGLQDLKEWPDKVRLMQERWIGKSYGATLKLHLTGEWPVASGEKPEFLEIYTTRPDTIFGMSFCAISPAHPIALSLATHHSPLATFLQECGRLGTSEEAIEKAEKKGIDTGLQVIHPFNGGQVPLYIANFVLMDYGTGAIFGCPAHDQRDFEFALKYQLPIIPVVSSQMPVVSQENANSTGNQQPATANLQEAYTGDGCIINSDFLNGLTVPEAKIRVLAELEKNGLGTAKINYRLRDWGISRQRYWGCPIPIIYCDACGMVPVPESQLPVELPRDVTFDKPGNPLDHHPTWKQVACPTCGQPAKRETDTFDTFFESSWYFARFTAPHAATPFDPKALDYWMPVDCYVGGIEHAVLHLLYARFFSRALQQCGFGTFPEPFKRLETQGMICHETYKNAEGKFLAPDEVGIQEAKNLSPNPESRIPAPDVIELKSGNPITVGRVEKMSKSKKNTVDPRHIIESYGADAARLFMLSDSPPERDLEWTDAGIEGSWRYINRVWKLLLTAQIAWQGECAFDDSVKSLRRLTHGTIAGVTDDIEHFHYNKAIARIRELSNALERSLTEMQAAASPAQRAALKEGCLAVVQLINPFLPHLAEELWQQLGYSELVSSVAWPIADAALLVTDQVTLAVQINGKLRTTTELPKDTGARQVETHILALAPVREALANKQVRKIIVVPNRIVNVVAN